MTCKMYLKMSVLASIDTEQPAGNSTNDMELESNISVHENTYPVFPADMDPLYTPQQNLFCLVFPPSCETVSSKTAKAI